jgi:hypothetical protein
MSKGHAWPRGNEYTFQTKDPAIYSTVSECHSADGLFHQTRKHTKEDLTCT